MYRVYRKRSKKMERNVQLKCRSMLVVPQKSARRATGEHLLQEQGALAKQILLQSFRIIELAWACSSAGRAPALQAGGRRFDPGHVHQILPECKRLSENVLSRQVDYSCTPCTNASLDYLCAQWRGRKASASPAGAISLAWRFNFSKASRFILSFICEYFLKTCASLWRSSCVTHQSGRAKRSPKAFDALIGRLMRTFGVAWGPWNNSARLGDKFPNA